MQRLWSFVFGTLGPRSIAAAVEAKNSSPNCFPNAPTVLKEIKFILYVHQLQGLQKLWSFVFGTSGPRSVAAAVGAKNSSPNCFLNAPTVQQKIICLYSIINSKACKSFGVFVYLKNIDFYAVLDYYRNCITVIMCFIIHIL